MAHAKINLPVKVKVHPAIGIARVGNGDGYFYGPEIPYPTAPSPDSYRDDQGRLNREAARFRVYAYYADGKVKELTHGGDDDVKITWKVHVANKKAAWYDFDAALDLPEAATLKSPRRNAAIQGADRKKLVIDAGEESISGPNHAPIMLTGRFFEKDVNLGELRTDASGRLIFLGGKGVSGSLPGYTLVTFANNPGWYDDTSDGPVSAEVRINETTMVAIPAWVLTGPPNYAPDLVTPQTMYDVIRDAISGSLVSRPTGKPKFVEEILPIFEQFNEAQWVNAGFFIQFGWKGPNDFMRPDVLKKLSTPAKMVEGHRIDPFAEMRRQIFYAMRNPSSNTFEPLEWPPIYGDAFGSYDHPPSPRAGFAFTKTIYKFLQQWMEGDFIGIDDDKNPLDHPESIDEVDPKDQPGTLDKAALHFCMGGPFHPGCEMTWPMRHASMYAEPFRLRHQHPVQEEPDYGEYLTQETVLSTDGPLSASGPGDISKWMAVPWQTDTASCRAGYPNTEFPADPYIPTFWPSRVPNTVLTEKNYQIIKGLTTPPDERTTAFYERANWFRILDLDAPYVDQITKMVHHFDKMGLILKQEGDADGSQFPEVMYVENLPEETRKELLAMGKAEADEHKPSVSPDFAQARFGGLRGRNR